jgi:hypothetical protein
VDVDEFGKWQAQVRLGGRSMTWGSYDTGEEARSAAKDWIETNGVMDGPGCDPPFIPC